MHQRHMALSPLLNPLPPAIFLCDVTHACEQYVETGEKGGRQASDPLSLPGPFLQWLPRVFRFKFKLINSVHQALVLRAWSLKLANHEDSDENGFGCVLGIGTYNEHSWGCLKTYW